ncbi:hypothetical protein [Fimbriiglobus ruber]|uniref:Uncharacterized protein n=1 Tax=Fimbriiglobus ruber TaxID=1908690 RepID=A0A225DT66_9BACT|nr:hypothetical protein [Fimbriiglobus ruber]OWK40786.1 hypothetical protein FRUB_04678 [Fimbriiglobus ruber]
MSYWFRAAAVEILTGGLVATARNMRAEEPAAPVTAKGTCKK